MSNIQTSIKNNITVQERILDNPDFLANFQNIINLISGIYQNGGKVLVAGNGGSAADAQHFAAEIVGRFKKERKAYPAIALTTNTSILTALANDYGFDFVFSRQIEAIATEKDLFIGISTSGNSKNLIEAVKTAKAMKIATVCLLGRNGGELEKISDYALVVPSDDTPRIQEAHIMILHIICEEIELNFK